MLKEQSFDLHGLHSPDVHCFRRCSEVLVDANEPFKCFLGNDLGVFKFCDPSGPWGQRCHYRNKYRNRNLETGRLVRRLVAGGRGWDLQERECRLANKPLGWGHRLRSVWRASLVHVRLVPRLASTA